MQSSVTPQSAIEKLTGLQHGNSICYSGYRDGQDPRQAASSRKPCESVESWHSMLCYVVQLARGANERTELATILLDDAPAKSGNLGGWQHNIHASP